MDITAFVTKKRDRALQVGDYNSYRSQLSRQLLSLRRKLGRTTPHRAKYSAKAPITVQDVAGNPEFVRYLLIQAERSWAHAMHIKSTHAEDNASKGTSGPTRKHIISKLHKAYGYANQLVKLLSDRQASNATDAAFLEAHAYALCMSGSEEFEKQATKRYDDPAVQRQAWSNCLICFSEAHIIYTALLFATKKEVYKEVLAGTVDPSIRYAAYQSKISRTIPIPTVAKQHFRQARTELLEPIQKLNPNALSQETTQVATAKDGASTLDIPTTITWRERTAPIADAAIGQALAATNAASANLSSIFASAARRRGPSKSAKGKANSPKALAAAYDPVLTGAQDTVDAVRRAIADLQKEGVSESDQRMQDLRVSDLATNYSLISWRVGRNRVLVSGATGDDGASFTLDSPRSTRPSKKSKQATTGTQSTQEEAATEAATAAAGAGSGASGPKKSTLLAHLRERAVLYDATLQSLDSVLSLRGAASSAPFAAEIAQKRAYFRALKCLNVGRSHAVVGAHAEALALFALAAQVLGEAWPELATVAAAKETETDADGDAHMSNDSASFQGEPPTLEISQRQAVELHRTLALTVTRQRGLVTLRQDQPKPSTGNIAHGSSAAGETTDPPLISTLHTYPSNAAALDLRNIVTYPPRLQPVPVKPIFLDLAWNYLEYPGRRSAKDEILPASAASASAAVSSAAAAAGNKAAEAGSKVAGKIAGAVGVDADMGDESGSEAEEDEGDRKEQQQQQAPAKKRGWFGFGRG